jgi:hypothetical protein
MRPFLLLCFLLALICASAMAASDREPKPLGIPLGATVEEARSVLTGNQFIEAGYHNYSGGPVFTVSGDGLDVQDLRSVMLVFDKSRHLGALEMTLSKSAFDRIFGYLKPQYSIKKSVIPFVGDKLVIMETKLARIEISAPHLSFEMHVTYITKPLHDAIVRGESERRNEVQKRERSRF